MAKFGIIKCDKITARPAACREPYTGEIIYIPSAYEKPLTVVKVFPHGVRTKERGYVHNNCIISKEQTAPATE